MLQRTVSWIPVIVFMVDNTVIDSVLMLSVGVRKAV